MIDIAMGITVLVIKVLTRACFGFRLTQFYLTSLEWRRNPYNWAAQSLGITTETHCVTRRNYSSNSVSSFFSLSFCFFKKGVIIYSQVHLSRRESVLSHLYLIFRNPFLFGNNGVSGNGYFLTAISMNDSPVKDTVVNRSVQIKTAVCCGKCLEEQGLAKVIVSIVRTEMKLWVRSWDVEQQTQMKATLACWSL